MIPRLTQLCFPNGLLSHEQDVPTFLAEFLMNVSSFLSPCLGGKKKERQKKWLKKHSIKVHAFEMQADHNLYPGSVPDYSCLTLGKWLNLLASVSLYVRWEYWGKNDNYITMCLAEL